MTSVQLRTLAVGSINAAGAAIKARGFTCVNNGVGDFTVTLGDGGADAAECLVFITPRTTAATAIPRVVHTSDTAKQILFLSDAGAAVDTAFDVLVQQFVAGTT